MTSPAKKINELDRRLERASVMETPVHTVVARYTTNAGQSFTSGALTIVDFEDMTFDTDSAVTTGAAWKFTCPTGKAGKYHVDAMIQFGSSATWAAGETLVLYIYKGGVQYSVIYYDVFQSATTTLRMAPGSDIVNLADGEYFDIRAVQSSGGALALNANGVYNHVAISRQ